MRKFLAGAITILILFPWTVLYIVVGYVDAGIAWVGDNVADLRDRIDPAFGRADDEVIDPDDVLDGEVA